MARAWPTGSARCVPRCEAFDPDIVLICGDDQYENFREDIIPAFCVMGLDQDFAIQPWAGGKAEPLGRDRPTGK